MPETKTRLTEASVAAYFAAIADTTRRCDCESLAKLMTKATRQPARMWGSAIVGFGTHHYKYESGRQGEICAVGFSSRKSDIVLYGLGTTLAREGTKLSLGQHQTGKGCVYLRKMADVNPKALEHLIATAFKERTKEG